MAEMLHEVCIQSMWFGGCASDDNADTQTFQKRLMDLMDQAQNFAGAGTGLVSGSGGSADPGQEFREGLDQTERECGSFSHCRVACAGDADMPTLVRSVCACPGGNTTNQDVG